jgi:hypothetical protein
MTRCCEWVYLFFAIYLFLYLPKNSPAPPHHANAHLSPILPSTTHTFQPPLITHFTVHSLSYVIDALISRVREDLPNIDAFRGSTVSYSYTPYYWLADERHCLTFIIAAVSPTHCAHRATAKWLIPQMPAYCRILFTREYHIHFSCYGAFSSTPLWLELLILTATSGFTVRYRIHSYLIAPSAGSTRISDTFSLRVGSSGGRSRFRKSAYAGQIEFLVILDFITFSMANDRRHHNLAISSSVRSASYAMIF